MIIKFIKIRIIFTFMSERRKMELIRFQLLCKYTKVEVRSIEVQKKRVNIIKVQNISM